MAFNISYHIQMKDEFSATLSKLNNDMSRMRLNMERTNHSFARMAQMQRDFGRAALVNTAKTSSRFKKMGDSMNAVGKSAFKKLTLPIGGAFALALRTASRFEAKMINVHSILKGTPQEMDRLAKKARDVASTSIFTPDEVANSMIMLAASGLKTNQILKSTAPILNLATAGMSDMGTATELTTSVMKSFQLDFSRTGEVTDVMATAFSNSNTNIFRLREGMKMLGATASSMGIDFKQATATLMVMSEAGVQGGLAGRQSAQLLRVLSENAKQLSPAFKKMGITAFDANGNIIDLQGAFKGLSKMMETAEKQGKKQEFLKAVTKGAISEKALRTVLTIGSTRFDEFNKQLNKAGGTADRMAKQHMEGVIGATKQLNSALQELSLSIFEPKVMAKIAHFLTNVAHAILNMSKNHPTWRKILVWVTGIAAVVGPLLIVLGKMVIVMRLLGISSTLGIGKMASGFGRLLGFAKPVLSFLWGMKRVLGFISIAIGTILIGFKKFREIDFSAMAEGLKGLGDAFKHPVMAAKIFGNLVTDKMKDIKTNISHPIDTLTNFVSPKNVPLQAQTNSTQAGGNSRLDINVTAGKDKIKTMKLKNDSSIPMQMGNYGAQGLT